MGAESSVEGQIALNLAKVLDERVGAQAGGVAATAKRLEDLITGLRESHKPKEQGRLAVLRGSA